MARTWGSERLSACVAVLASAAAFALYARAEWPWCGLGWIGLVPWLAVLDRTRSLRGTLAAGVLMCEAFVVVVFHWLPSAIQNYTGAPWALAFVIVLCAAPLIEPQFLAFAVGRHVARQVMSATAVAAVLAGACLYVGTEWAVPKLFADTLGHGLYASALMRQAADLAGAHGLTFVLIIGNECVLAALRAAAGEWNSPAESRQVGSKPTPIRSPLQWALSDSAREFIPGRQSGAADRLRRALMPAGCIAALVLALLAYGAVRYRQLSRDDGSVPRLTAGIAQANISQYARLAAELGTFDAVRRIIDVHFALSAEALRHGPLDFLVWPETVYPTTFGSPKSEAGAAFDQEIGAFVDDAGMPLVFGAYDAAGGDEFNAAILLEPAADGRRTVATYRKASLFPLTERIPVVFDWALVRRTFPWLGTWKPGKSPPVLPLHLRDGRTLGIAPLICYDALNPSHAIAAVRQGAELIVTLSNDSWFAYGNVPRLILIISAFRSLETRRPQVRAANTGVSAMIMPTGEFPGTVAMDERGTLVGGVTPVRNAQTLMLMWGDWFGPTAFLVGVASLVAPLVHRQLGSAPPNGRESA
jgi:apolipoprotein N-acyltransferase